MSFRTRTALATAVLTAIALGGAFSAVAAAFNGLQLRQLDASLLAIAASETAEAPKLGFHFSSGPGPAGNDVGPLTTYGVIFDETGRVLSATAPFYEQPLDQGILLRPLGTAFDLMHGGVHMRAVLVGVPGHLGKHLLVATSRDDLDGDEAFLFKAMLTAFGVAVAWIGFIAYWMSGRLIRDHQAIATVARRVAGGDLSARTAVGSRDPEVVQLASDIDEMVERLGELVDSQQRFIAHAAHELRSPLAALSGELQQALRKPRSVDDYKGVIQSSLAAARRLTVLAEDLLALARIKTDATSPPEVIEISAMLAAAVGGVEHLANAHGVAVSRPTAVRGWVADRRGDTSRLLRNLLENAIRFSPPGETVRIGVTSAGAMARIVVADSGPGIDVAERNQVFTPFFRGKGAASTEGTGLGLGIAREIANSYGGDVELDATSAVGARFIVSLPLANPCPATRTGDA
jgi:two-component system OmpR family sensor kinase